jgi:hypothetical protein
MLVVPFFIAKSFLADYQSVFLMASTGHTWAQMEHPVQSTSLITGIELPLSSVSPEPVIAGQPTLKQFPQAIQTSVSIR